MWLLLMASVSDDLAEQQDGTSPRLVFCVESKGSVYGAEVPVSGAGAWTSRSTGLNDRLSEFGPTDQDIWKPWIRLVVAKFRSVET